MPLTATDDYLGHQTATPFSEVGMADTKHAIFTERFWYMGTIAPAGDTVFGFGLGYYPNRGVMDCYAAVTLDGVQHNFRASRSTANQPLSSAVGPLEFEVVEGMREHRILLRPNESGLSMDLRFLSDRQLHDEGRETRHRGDALLSDVTRFVQTGVYEGAITLNGKTIPVSPETCWGARDRSWGLRVEARSDESHPPVSRFPPIFYAFFCAHFPDHSIHFFFKENPDGSYRLFCGDEVGRQGARPPRRIVALEHDIAWAKDDFGQHVERGVFRLTYEDGGTKDLPFTAKPGRLYLKGGLYGGLRGWFQGDPRGELHTEHNTWSFADAADRREARTLAEQVLEIRDGDAVGYGTLQSGVAEGYTKYQEIQHLPPM